MRNDSERFGSDAEIDLFDLAHGVWRYKTLVILIAVAFTAISALYAFFAKEVYEAKVFVHPPTVSDIAQLNYGRGDNSGLVMLTTKDVYTVYIRDLQSESLSREFFRKFYYPSLTEREQEGSRDDLYSQFQSEVISFGVADRNSPERYYLSLRVSDPQKAAEWAAWYVERAGFYSKKEVVKDVKADALTKANNLDQRINAARESARLQREDSIAKLTEALRIAKSVGLEKPPLIANSLTSEVSSGMSGALSYMRGSKALQAEIENLQSRTSDDPFISDLRAKQEELSFYRDLQVAQGLVQTYRQDGAIESPDQPLKPKKLLIIVLGGILGLTVGLMVALAFTLRVPRRVS